MQKKITVGCCNSATFSNTWKIFAVLMFCLAIIALPHQALGINIVMNFNSGNSDYPAYDPDGSDLIALMGAVESYYEDIFENSGTLTVDFYYDNIDSLAVHNNTGTSGGHPTSCRIRIDTTPNWFLDPTPLNNSEFNMVQTLAGDISDPGSRYDGSVPDLLEYSYKGNTNGSDPDASGFDLFSVLLHEMGHGLGMTSATAWWETFWDDDYDFSSSLVWGNSMAADCYSSSNRYHLAAATGMYPTTPSGRRKLPSATDLFAIACAGDWGGSIDLMRKEFYSTATNADLNNGSYWSGNWGPDSTEDAWIRDGGSARLTADMTVNELYVGGSTTVRTGVYDLRADQNCTVGDGSDVGYLEVESSGKLLVDKALIINSGSQVIMNYNSEVQVDEIHISTGGELIGRGVIVVDSAFHLNGKITTSGGAITIYSDVPVNLDGGGNGEMYVTGGSFYCNAPLNDAHDGYIKVGSGYDLVFDDGWSLGSGGVLDLDGSTANTRLLTYTAPFRAFGVINLIKDSNFYCDTTFESSSTINMPNSEDDLYIHNDLYIEDGATFTGAGRLYGLAGSSIEMEDGAEVAIRYRVHGDFTIEDGGIGTAVTGCGIAFDSTTNVIMEASDDGVCDLLDTNNTTTYLRGDLILDLIDGYTPEVGDSFTVITYDIRNGTFASVACSDPSVSLTASYSSTALTLLVTAVDSAIAVPEPSTIVLLIGAALGLGVFWKKRR
ncbi:MAG: PEP-CTERM sorting domain-containing protein [Planctomycetia bacterium]|jgi:hypothetical protein